MDRLAVVIWILQVGCSSAEIRQPWGRVPVKGQNASLKCTQDNGHNSMYWFQQKGGRELQLLFQFYSRELQSNEKVPGRFTADQPQSALSHLRIASVEPEDSAVYFCASSLDTALQKSEDDITPPNVIIFAPSTQELQEKQKITIVCLVTDFYPDHVILTWTLDGNKRTEGIKTEEPNLDNAVKKFSLTSRLRVTKKEWEETKEFTCQVYFDPKNTTYSATIPGQVCDGSAAKDLYLQSTNLGELIYILLIVKSTLYGAFITGLMLRKKSVKEKTFT
ncbi:hypothetical protein lerEdw1_009035 [Lerista edwardsae]|nr:hypothetical protein lerEdw1_009035 [Lerista edwardsae]